MCVYYSKSTKGFYIDEVHGSNIPKDVIEITDEKHKELINLQSEGYEIALIGDELTVVKPEISKEDYERNLTKKVQKYLDDKAKELGYDSILSLCTYATSKVKKLAKEGQAGVDFRDQVWEICYQNIDDMIKFDELVAKFPDSIGG